MKTIAMEKLAMILKPQDGNGALFYEWVLIKIMVFRCFDSICAPILIPRTYVVLAPADGGLQEGKGCGATESSVSAALNANHSIIQLLVLPVSASVLWICSFSTVKMLSLTGTRRS